MRYTQQQIMSGERCPPQNARVAVRAPSERCSDAAEAEHLAYVEERARAKFAELYGRAAEHVMSFADDLDCGAQRSHAAMAW